jgi:N-acetylmuramoyl-L-alanine amidase
MKKIFSPNFNFRSKETKIDMVILHYTGMQSKSSAIKRLCDKRAKVSSHYLIDQKGEISILVDEQFTAWHAGKAYWKKARDINNRSIGIELVNPGHRYGYKQFTKKQISSLTTLLQKIIKKYRIPKNRILGHSDVAPQRKKDPGELFDWHKLARKNIGIWPENKHMKNNKNYTIKSMQQMLAHFGYEISISGKLDHQTKKVVSAFQRHFRPKKINGIFDDETIAKLLVLNRKK